MQRQLHAGFETKKHRILCVCADMQRNELKPSESRKATFGDSSELTESNLKSSAPKAYDDAFHTSSKGHINKSGQMTGFGWINKVHRRGGETGVV